MTGPLLHVLLVEDDDDHAELIRRHLARSRSGARSARLERVDRLSSALERLGRDGVDALLLDLNLPDSRLHATLDAVLGAHPELPIVVLTSLDDIDFAAEAVQRGAQDYLVKSEVSGELILRAVRHAIERKAAQRQLQRYAAQLERRNEELRRFAHIVAHEVRNPLNVVSLCLRLVRQTGGDPAQVDNAIGMAEGSVSGLADLVRDLLEFADAEAPAGDHQVVSMDDVLARSIEVLRETLREGRATVTGDPLPPVRGHPTQLQHLLQNLIGNAVKYRGDRPPAIHVGADPSPGDGWATFRVLDNGRGIAPEDHERIFEMFSRMHDPQEIQGTGIGLAFCKRVVENHGGRIWVEPAPGVGSAFCFTLPAAEPGQARPDDPPLEAAASA